MPTVTGNLATPRVIATGLNSAGGCAYWCKTDQLLIAESGGSTPGIYAISVHGPTHVPKLVGTGYGSPADVALSADGVHAYVADYDPTKQTAALYRVPLSNLSLPTIAVASGLNGIGQIAVDEAHGFAYVAEFSQITRISLSTGNKAAMVRAGSLRGVLVSKDGRFVYFSDDGDTISRLDTATKTRSVIARNLDGPRYLAWADARESQIVFPQRNPVGAVLLLDLTASPPAVRTIVEPTQHDPYSVAVVSPNQLLITSLDEVSAVDLTSAVYSATGNVFLGIGFVPADAKHLPGGYANTTMDTDYFFQVKNCPFGGTLPIMVNWQGVPAGAKYYQVLITGPGKPEVAITQPFTDYLWNALLNQFVAVPRSPEGGSFYPLRSAGEVWLNEWLGGFVDTTCQPNGLNTISIKLFSAPSPGSEIGQQTDPGRSAKVMIDNTEPVAILEQILQEPGDIPVNTCGIVNTGSPTFKFKLTASAPQSHLKGWDLTAYWGDNKSKSVASDDYDNHSSRSPLWAGLTDATVPATSWDATVYLDSQQTQKEPTSVHCAHSFFLTAWDRVINGWGYIHGWARYQKSVTLLF